MDSFHEDEINFGHEEAVRMHATAKDPWHEAEKWLNTTTGQEFCDELVWGTVGIETLNAVLKSLDINLNAQNRRRIQQLADKVMR